MKWTAYVYAVIKFVSHLSKCVFNNYFQGCCHMVLQFNHCSWKSRHTNSNGVFYKPNHHKKQSDNKVWWSWRSEMLNSLIWYSQFIIEALCFFFILLHQNSIKVNDPTGIWSNFNQSQKLAHNVAVDSQKWFLHQQQLDVCWKNQHEVLHWQSTEKQNKFYLTDNNTYT